MSLNQYSIDSTHRYYIKNEPFYHLPETRLSELYHYKMGAQIGV